jgi:N-acetylglucosamine-6-sulfatase
VPLRLPQEADSWIAFTKGQIWSGIFGPIQPYYRRYCETVVALDREIGRLLQELDNLGILEDTFVVYASDNGYFWGEHRMVDKRWAYEESIRIPMIIRYSDTAVGAGFRAEEMVLNIDLAPTLLELAGIPAPSFMEGRSLLPILRGRQTPWRTEWLYEYFKDFPYNVPAMQALRTERFKYIAYEGKKGDELFDLRNDPQEKRNLLNTRELRDRLLSLKKMLERVQERREK